MSISTSEMHKAFAKKLGGSDNNIDNAKDQRRRTLLLCDRILLYIKCLWNSRMTPKRDTCPAHIQVISPVLPYQCYSFPFDLVSAPLLFVCVPPFSGVAVENKLWQ